MSNENLGKVVMSKQICWFCRKEEDIIVMQKRAGSDKVSQLEGEIIDYIDGGCEECKGYMEKGIIIISTKDDDREYRTGGWWVITETSAMKFIKDKEMRDSVREQRCLLLSDAACSYIGLEVAK